MNLFDRINDNICYDNQFDDLDGDFDSDLDEYDIDIINHNNNLTLMEIGQCNLFFDSKNFLLMLNDHCKSMTTNTILDRYRKIFHNYENLENESNCEITTNIKNISSKILHYAEKFSNENDLLADAEFKILLQEFSECRFLYDTELIANDWRKITDASSRIDKKLENLSSSLVSNLSNEDYV